MRRNAPLAVVVLFLGLMLARPSNTSAQDSATCERFTGSVVSEVGSQCAEILADEVCYGFGDVETITSAPSLPLTTPGQTTYLRDTQIVDTSPLDVTARTYGIAPLRVRANLPVGHPGRDLVMLPLGNVEIGNGVDASQALTLSQSERVAQVTTAGQTTLYRTPSALGQVAGVVGAGTVLLADAFDVTNQWLRVYYEYDGDYDTRSVAWLSRTAIRPVNALTLPRIRTGAFTPMQRFFFKNGFAPTPCPGAPNGMLLLQVPQSLETEFFVNDADVLMTGAIALQLRQPATMELRVLDGLAVVCRGTPNEIIIPEGFSIDLPLIVPADVRIADRTFFRAGGCGWTNLRLLTPSEVEGMALLEGLPNNILNDDLSLPTIVCASGVGGPICEIEIDDAASLAAIARLCRDERVEPVVCDLVRGL